MIDAVFQLLFRYDGSLSEKHIAMFHGLKQPNEISELRRVLSSDERFIKCSDSRWKCAPIAHLIENRKIEDIEFIITDIETTGSLRGKDRIIEIAALKVKNGITLDSFDTLVDPEIPISNQITRLTKITDQAVQGAPKAEAVLPQFSKFVGNGIVVAHNSLFDYYFINAELRRIGEPSLQNCLEVCTFRLAKKLLPKVKERGVAGLARYYDYNLGERHRAMPDVEATKFYFDQFLKQLQEENITTLHQLIEFQKEEISKKNLKRKLKRFQNSKHPPRTSRRDRY